MKVKFMSMDCKIIFPMKNGETKEAAEDRLLDIMAKNNIEPVSWWDQEIEEFDGDPGCIICKHNDKTENDVPCIGCGEGFSHREFADGWADGCGG